jgi:phage tail protein X
MARTTPYTTKSGDRWDTISYAAYGNVKYMRDIIRANPTVALWTEFKGGVTLQIPVKERPEVSKSNLPPWRR